MYHQRFKTEDQRWREKFVRLPGKGSCWVWKTGGPNEYPKFLTENGYERASRYSYRKYVGKIPRGKHVLHECDNPKCIRPSHLFIGTHQDNMIDRCAKKRNNAPSGERNGRAKITRDEADEIRRLYAAGGVSQQALANKYGIAQTGVSRIIRDQGWVE